MGPDEITFSREEAIDLLVVLDDAVQRFLRSGERPDGLILDLGAQRALLFERLFPDFPMHE